MPKRAPRGYCPSCPARPPITKGVLARHWQPGSTPGSRRCPGSRQPSTDPPPPAPIQDPDPLLTVLAQRRQELGLLQSDVAAAAGLSRQYYGQVERGTRHTSLATVRRICQVLHLHLDVIPVEQAAGSARAKTAMKRALTRALSALDAMARQPVISHDLVDRARDAIRAHTSTPHARPSAGERKDAA